MVCRENNNIERQFSTEKQVMDTNEQKRNAAGRHIVREK